ncbi:MAG: hypothetical protein WC796_00665 [Candidatus Pacearchaeota archaeon]|jgi:hypothetical protein
MRNTFSGIRESILLRLHPSARNSRLFAYRFSSDPTRDGLSLGDSQENNHKLRGAFVSLEPLSRGEYTLISIHNVAQFSVDNGGLFLPNDGIYKPYACTYRDGNAPEFVFVRDYGFTPDEGESKEKGCFVSIRRVDNSKTLRNHRRDGKLESAFEGRFIDFSEVPRIG